MENLKGKTAFITGGASGIGLGLAKACAKEGMNVVIADLRQSAIDEAVPIFEENNWPVLAIQLDVTDRKAYEKAVDQAEAKFGNIHLLANNAGIGGGRGPLWEVSYAQTDVAININLTAVLNGIQIIVPRMLQHGEGGHIVSTASKAALIAVPQNGLYNLTKQALVGITETLQSDLAGTNVTASVFFPGPFATTLGQTSVEIEAQFLGSEAKAPAPPPPPPPKDGAPMPSLSDMSALVRSADEAGERILRGVKRGDMYIITHAEFKEGFKERVDAMLRAFPDEKPSEKFKEAFGFLVHNPVFNRQKDVPAFEKKD
ncbi:MAG: SDR family NAD(P)-dependent oxidoreductase [Oscillospiraceae bacterium]|nr:SDR family NAD(P)-dependent oxidoreductase [Oscillospiraceae bacterium]